MKKIKLIVGGNFLPQKQILRAVLSCLTVVALSLVLANSASAFIIINAPMTDTNSTGWILGGSPNSAILTGDGVIDPAGDGWLRLTNATGNQTGYAYNSTSFDLSQGLLIEFDYATWGGSGADGYSVYLFDAGVSSFNIGAFGGSLGYAQKGASTGGTCTANGSNIPGMSGGYIGIGVDEYGNFSDCAEGRYLPANDTTTAANTVTIRGAVAGFGGGAIGSTQGLTSYPWLATSGNYGSLWYNGSPRPSQTGANYRHVRIQISPAPNPIANVWIAYGYNSPLVYTQLLSNVALPSISASQLLKIGYAASTGGSTNYHEVRNLLVSNQNTSSAIDLSITKTFSDLTSGSTTTARVNDQIQYKVIASNSGPNNITATGVGITDNVPANITGVGWTCAASGGATCGAASGSGNTINTTANLPLNGYVTYTITGTLGSAPISTLTNTASLVIPGSITDYNSSDDSDTVSVPIASDLSNSTKNWIDLNGGDQNPGDTIQYTITLNETGHAPASGVAVTDTFPAALTNLAVTACPAGATCSLSGQTLTVSNVSVPADSSVSIVVSSDIANGTAAGTTIDNSATIANPGGVGDTAVAPTITVAASQIPQAGNKPLYLGDLAAGYNLTRSKPTGLSGYAIINKNSGTTPTRSWTLNPALAGNVSTITSANSVAVYLWLAEGDNTNRTVEVRLACSSNLTVYATSGNITLSYGIQTGRIYTTARQFTFNLSGNLPMSCTSGAGNTWRLDVFNKTTGGGTRDLYVYPMSGTNNSYVDLPSANVINVDSVGLYSAGYSGGTALASIQTGSTVYIRSVVSDPFGSYDITGATVTITDSTGAVALPATAMAMKNDSGAATKTYEYPYTVPVTGPAGNWTVRVDATEGSEGTVTDFAQIAMPVTAPPPPNLSVLKSASVANANPGQTIVYTVQILNSGGQGTNVVLTDSMSQYTAFCLTCYSGVRFNFADGTPASGLSLGTPQYSNDNGSTWTYTPVNQCGGAPAGYDGCITNWRVPMTGTINAGGGFTLNYQAIVK